MTRIEAWRCGALLALLTLAACRTSPPPAPPASAQWSERRPQLQALQHFGLKGRIALSAGGNGFNANLRWLQEQDHSQVSLEGPLGVGGMQISARGADLDVLTSRGEHITSDAAHAELRARLGFDVPLASLRFWVLGVPDPASPAQEILDAEQQRLASLAQDGWQVSYAAYERAGSEALPARLTLERDTVRVRLLIEDWQL
jgi:outer membrane lipoprotein LolB